MTILVASLLATTALAGCMQQDGGNGGGGGDGEAQTIVMGIPAGWIGEEMRSYMVEWVLENEMNYTVETFEDLEAGPIYAGLGDGSVNVFVGAWLPLQQSHLNAQPEGSIVRLGHNLPEGEVSVGLCVPQYVVDAGVSSIADLEPNGEQFEREIQGIEAGAGMMITAQERIGQQGIYDLGEWNIIEASTPAMMAAYDDSVATEDWIVVMCWRPHFMFAAWEGDQQMVILDDPGEEVDGETRWLYADPAEAPSVETLVNDGFQEEYPEAADFLENFQISIEEEEQLMLEVEEGGDPREIAVNFVQDNPQIVDQWLGR